VGKNLVLFAVSVGIALFLVEWPLRLFYELPPIWKEPQIKHLESPLLDWVQDENSRSYSIDAPVSINSAGLRDDEIPREKPDGEIRVLALGDSFTFALGVRHEDIWAQQLERILNERRAPQRFQVINAGVAGYNTRQELIYLLHDGYGWDPDLVIVGFYWNDLVGNEPPFPPLDSTPRVAPGAVAREEPSDHLLPAWARDRIRRSLVIYLPVTRAKQIWYSLVPPDDRYSPVQRAILTGDEALLEPYWLATGTRLLEIAGSGKERGIPVALLVFPMENQTKRSDPGAAFVGRLRRIWEPTGMPLVDVAPAYIEARQRGENPFQPYDLHPDASGMTIAAELVYQALAERDLLPR
jgi:lysophospholipase L1-like esterase